MPRGATTQTADALTFEGYLSTQGGGFAYATVGLGDVDLSGTVGIRIGLSSLALSSSSAPLAFEVALTGGSGCCGLSANFAVPATESEGEAAVAYISNNDWIRKRAVWYSSYCGCVTDLSSVTKMSIGLYYQEGAYSLRISSMEADDPRS